MWPLLATAALSVEDGAGNRVVLAQPAQRIVSLAPHITETLFAIGAGARIVGAVQYSDYPEAAKNIPRVGSYNQLDLENILSLKPDLIVAWSGGNSAQQINDIRKLNVPLYLSDPHRISEIATEMENLGTLSGGQAYARKKAEAWRLRFKRLRLKYQSKSRVTVFYQLWHQPLMTIGGGQLIDNVINHCGGKNIFSTLRTQAPAISREAVLSADPSVIIVGGLPGQQGASMEYWQNWPWLRAVKNRNVFGINPDLLHRHGPRILDGMSRVCEKIQLSRQHSGS